MNPNNPMNWDKHKPKLITIEELELVLEKAKYQSYRKPDGSFASLGAFNLREYLRRINVPLDKLFVFFIPSRVIVYSSGWDLEEMVIPSGESENYYALVAAVDYFERSINLMVAPLFIFRWFPREFYGQSCFLSGIGERRPKLEVRGGQLSPVFRVTKDGRKFPRFDRVMRWHFRPSIYDLVDTYGRHGVGLEEIRTGRDKDVNSDVEMMKRQSLSYLDYPEYPVESSKNIHIISIRLDPFYNNKLKEQIEKERAEKEREEANLRWAGDHM